MTADPQLFPTPPCGRCGGHGRIHDPDTRERVTCPTCGGTGVRATVCRICGQDAHGGDYCGDHDPTTCPLPL